MGTIPLSLFIVPQMLAYPDKTMDLGQLNTHIKDKARTCRWHSLIQEFVQRVFREPERHRKNLKKQAYWKKMLYQTDIVSQKMKMVILNLTKNSTKSQRNSTRRNI